MKIKIYSIILLLSFWPVIAHDMIPHHHGDCGVVFHIHVEKDNSTPFDGIYSLSHLTPNHHPNCDDHNEVHKPTIPSHSHVSIANSFDYIRRNVNLFGLQNDILLYFYPPESSSLLSTIQWAGGQKIFYDRPLFLNPSNEPGAYCLRAPPALS